MNTNVKSSYINVLIIDDLFIHVFSSRALAGAQLPPPHNLNVISMNTNYTLTWDWDQGSAESGAVNFTTHYVA